MHPSAFFRKCYKDKMSRDAVRSMIAHAKDEERELRLVAWTVPWSPPPRAAPTPLAAPTLLANPAPPKAVPQWSAKLWASEHPTRAVGAGDDIAHLAKRALAVLVDTPVPAIGVVVDIFREIKPVVDATSGPRAPDDVRKKVFLALVYRFWSHAYGPAKSKVLQLTLDHVLKRFLHVSVPSVATAMLAFDVCKRVETLVWNTAHLRTKDPAILLRTAVLDAVDAFLRSKAFEEMAKTARSVPRKLARAMRGTLARTPAWQCLPGLDDAACRELLTHLLRTFPM